MLVRRSPPGVPPAVSKIFIVIISPPLHLVNIVLAHSNKRWLIRGNGNALPTVTLTAMAWGMAEDNAGAVRQWQQQRR